MDVADRSVRLDVFSPLPAAAEPPSTETIESTFGESLLRRQFPATVPLAADEISGEVLVGGGEGALLPAPELLSSLLKELPPVADAVEWSTGTALPMPAPVDAPAPRETSATTEDGGDLKKPAPDLPPLPALVVEAAPSPAAVLSTRRAPESLAKAWQSSPAKIATASKESLVDADEETPPMPGGLQAALASTSVPVTWPASPAEEPSAASRPVPPKITATVPAPAEPVVGGNHAATMRISVRPSEKGTDEPPPADGAPVAADVASKQPQVSAVTSTAAANSLSAGGAALSLAPAHPLDESLKDVRAASSSAPKDEHRPADATTRFPEDRPAPIHATPPAPPGEQVTRAEAPPIAGPAMPASTTHEAGPNVFEQVHPKLQEAVFHDRQLTIALRPPELGLVRIDIVRHEGRLTARLQTETETAHRLLTDHLPQLQDALTLLGLTGDEVRIVRAEGERHEGASFGWFSGGEAGSRHEGRGRQDAPPPPAALAEDAESDEAMVRTRTALNLRI